MNVQQVMSAVDEKKPNTVPEGVKLGWLNTVEQTIYVELVKLREDSEAVICPQIDMDSYDTELIADGPYSRLYEEYLLCKIDFYNQEWESYNNSASQFQQSYNEYAAYYNSMHKYKRNCRMKNFM